MLRVVAIGAHGQIKRFAVFAGRGLGVTFGAIIFENRLSVGRRDLNVPGAVGHDAGRRAQRRRVRNIYSDRQRFHPGCAVDVNQFGNLAVFAA